MTSEQERTLSANAKTPRPLITPGKIYEFNEDQGGGRFQMVKVVALAGDPMPGVFGGRLTFRKFDVWECVYLGGSSAPVGSARPLDEEEIFALANEIPFQVGQTWIENSTSHVGKLLWCLLTPPPGTPGAFPVWSWEVEDVNGERCKATEAYLLKNCARVDGVDAPAAVDGLAPYTSEILAQIEREAVAAYTRPLSVRETIAARTKPAAEPWRSSVDDWDLLPDAVPSPGVLAFAARRSLTGKDRP